MLTLLQARKSGNAADFATATQLLLIPAPDKWFSEVFGPETGRGLATQYPSTFTRELAELFDGFLSHGYTEVTVRRFGGSCDPLATEGEYPVLAARVRETPFYGVRFEDVTGRSGHALSFFVPIAGLFRYTGRISFRAPPVLLGRILQEVPESAQEARRLDRVRVGYPQRAYDAHIEGLVRIWAVIRKDGTVDNIRLISGHCWLAEPVLKAAAGWRFQPAMINGEPQDVACQFRVTFRRPKP